MFAANASLRYITQDDDEKVDANRNAAKMQSRAKEDFPSPFSLTTTPSHLPPSPPAYDYDNSHAQEASPGWPTGWAAGEAVPFAANGACLYNSKYYRGGQQQLPAFAPLHAAFANSIYGGSGYYYGDHNLYAPGRCQPTPFGYSYLTADSTIAPASNHFNADAHVFVPPQQVKSGEFNIPDRLQRINKFFRYISEVSSAPSSTSRQDKPKRLPGNQRRQKAAESRKGKSEGQGAATVHRSTKRYINAPRVHMMARPLPSSLYTQLASEQPQLLPAPRPLLVVLDLNGTLLKRSKFSGNNNFTPRPFVKEFLTYLFANHKVMIWSSARPENVAAMCSDLFTPEQQKQLVAVWGRDHLGLSPEAYNAKVQVYKQLSWVWNDTTIQAVNPNKEYMWTQANTVLVDDSIGKSASEPHNLIEVEEFRNQPEQVKSDDYLRAVVRYLKDLSDQTDVSAYIRSQPFRHEPGVEFISTRTEKGSKELEGENYIRFDDW